jgi:hypothetical protein
MPYASRISRTPSVSRCAFFGERGSIDGGMIDTRGATPGLAKSSSVNTAASYRATWTAKNDHT